VESFLKILGNVLESIKPDGPFQFLAYLAFLSYVFYLVIELIKWKMDGKKVNADSYEKIIDGRVDKINAGIDKRFDVLDDKYTPRHIVDSIKETNKDLLYRVNKAEDSIKDNKYAQGLMGKDLEIMQKSLLDLSVSIKGNLEQYNAVMNEQTVSFRTYQKHVELLNKKVLQIS